MARTSIGGIIGVCLLCGAFTASAQPPPQTPSRDSRGDGSSPPGLLPEPAFITKAVDRVDRRSEASGDPKDGFYLESGKMAAGAGWLSIGPGYRRHVFSGTGVLRVSGAVSTRLYKMAQVGLEFPHLRNDRLRAGLQGLWRDSARINYYGLGSASNEGDRSGYRLTTFDLTGYSSIGRPSLQLGARAGWLHVARPSDMIGRANYPDTIAVFSESAAPGLLDAVSYLHSDVSLTSDTRDQRGYPTSGSFYQATFTNFSDVEAGRHSLQRLEGEATRYIPVIPDRWIISAHGSVAVSHADADQTVPIYLMPTLGGRNLRGALEYRFHDRNMHAYAVESRWGIMSHVEAAVFAEAGNVAPAAGQLRFTNLKTSYGAGVRLHSRKLTMARLDFARGAEGWRVVFKLNDPFHPSRESTGWRMVAPFVP